MKFEIVSPKETITTFELKTNRELVDGIVEEFYTVSTATAVKETPEPPFRDRFHQSLMIAFDYMADKPTAFRIKQFREFLKASLNKVEDILFKSEKDKESV